MISAKSTLHRPFGEYPIPIYRVALLFTDETYLAKANEGYINTFSIEVLAIDSGYLK